MCEAVTRELQGLHANERLNLDLWLPDSTDMHTLVRLCAEALLKV
jgi:hypothetical protein